MISFHSCMSKVSHAVSSLAPTRESKFEPDLVAASADPDFDLEPAVRFAVVGRLLEVDGAERVVTVVDSLAVVVFALPVSFAVIEVIEVTEEGTEATEVTVFFFVL